MMVHVRLFARARDLAGSDALCVQLPEGATVADLRRRLATDCPALAPLLERSALAVENEFAEDTHVLSANAEVALLPPVSGGQPSDRGSLHATPPTLDAMTARRCNDSTLCEANPCNIDT